MSDTIKLSIKARKLKAVVPQEEIKSSYDTFYEEESIKKELESKYNLGFENGYEKAKDDLEENYINQIVEKSEQFYTILSQIEDKLKEYETSFNKIVLQVSQEIAKKILQRELEQNNIIGDTIKSAIQKILGAGEVKIKVNPEDYQFLTENDFTKKHLVNFNKVKFESNEKIEKGGCFIETEIGNVDARISSQVNEVINALSNQFVDSDDR